MTNIVAAILLTQENMKRVQPMQKAVDSINLNPNSKKSVEYARARAAINHDCYTLYKDNAAAAKNFKVARKKVIIEFLGGKIQKVNDEQGYRKLVVFPDESKARY